ncbi:carboxylate--amine ligase [Vaginisenegalia massiliensis]|uniref:carboxylate--amine ligase n=1 Tax=Vaginisenegalia massiliensis TaxID=2058294 RepID=UPI000F5294ED|nr:carboxylate--amine ligase [Vaginisenegalia massiliensis]
MARAFHEAYGLKSIAYSAGHLAPTKYSKIVDIHVIPNFIDDQVFLATLKTFIAEHQGDGIQYLLVACGDGYAKLVSKYMAELSQFFICPYIDFDLYEKLENKKDFYQICDQYHLPYPSTVIATDQVMNDLANFVDNIQFSYPMVLKPNDSISYLELDFPGKKKAFIIESAQEMKDTLQAIYQAGYPGEMIIQDMIPGDDSKMRVLNAYVDQNHQVRMMCLGHPLLEDPSPVAVGNYLAILPDFDMTLYQLLKNFLEQIKYVGYANFDMKFDERDGQYKLFEINLRQGRSSYYVTLNGYNMARYLVEDRIFNKPFTQTEFVKGDKLWLGAPKGLVEKYLKDDKLKEEVRFYLDRKAYGTTSFYSKDRSLKRWLLNHYVFYRYYGAFKKYYKEELK